MARNSRAIKNGNLTTLLVADLFRRQELENPHGRLATRTAPDRRLSRVRHVRWRRSRQQSSAEGEALAAPPVRQEAEIADARESPWEDPVPAGSGREQYANIHAPGLAQAIPHRPNSSRA